MFLFGNTNNSDAGTQQRNDSRAKDLNCSSLFEYPNRCALCWNRRSGSSEFRGCFFPIMESFKVYFFRSRFWLFNFLLALCSKSSSNLFLAGLTYFIKASDKGVWGASLKYFNLGEIDLNDYLGGQVVSLGVEKPNELSLDLSYSLKLSEPFSMGITARYLRSDLGNLNENRAVNSIAFDIGAYYQSQSSDEVIFRHGAVLSNLGPRVKYSEFKTPNFIPTTLKLGTGAQFNLSDSQSLELVLEFNKLLFL